MTRQADFKRRVRARMAKTGESYATARAQLLAEHGGPIRASMRAALHVTNGDSAAGTLRETTLVERVLPWRDALHEGPVPALPDNELRRVRAAFLAEVLRLFRVVPDLRVLEDARDLYQPRLLGVVVKDTSGARPSGRRGRGGNCR